MDAIRRATPRIKARGGYCPDLAIRRILFKELAGKAPAEYATLFVLVTASNAVPIGGVDEMLGLAPDARVVDVSETASASSERVLLFSAADAWTLLSAESGGWVFSGESGEDVSFHVRSGTGDLAVKPGLRMPAGSKMEAIAHIQKWASMKARYPAAADQARVEMLKIAKQNGILAPETAFMVVENSAQWRTLERAEKKSMASNAALEFDEFKTPEPEFWMILAGFAVWLGIRRFSNRRGAGTQAYS